MYICIFCWPKRPRAAVQRGVSCRHVRVGKRFWKAKSDKVCVFYLLPFDASPREAIDANEEPTSLKLVANHVRENVRWAMEYCPTDRRSSAKNGLP